MGFEKFNFHSSVMAGIKAAGYASPTPIQEKAFEPCLSKKDVMGLAQTGTGKTAAFVLPILQHLIEGPRGKVRALIVAPTRELAEQIHESIASLGKETGLKSMTIYGGVSIKNQIKKLRAGAEIIVACPGRLLDHIGQMTVNLAGLEVLVLDEADRMFDMGFLPDIKKIVRKTPIKKQTLLFSATMPDSIRGLCNEVLRDPVTVKVSHTAPSETVTHALYQVTQDKKSDLLFELLHATNTESVLIFTRTKHRAKRLGVSIEKAGYTAASLQGNLSQNKRQDALNGFRDGTYQILVATDIAARGIDVSSISHVINYDMPDTADAYTHRIGRTGRAAKTGDAFTFVTHEDEALVKAVERIMGRKVERRVLEGYTDSRPVPSSGTAHPRHRDGRKPAHSRGHTSGTSTTAQPSRPARKKFVFKRPS
ncbi:DEAD/DEAH box helicase [bacterium]|nr:DEAD/DEAH box helicase [bacterium]